MGNEQNVEKINEEKDRFIEYQEYESNEVEIKPLKPLNCSSLVQILYLPPKFVLRKKECIQILDWKESEAIELEEKSGFCVLWNDSEFVTTPHRKSHDRVVKRYSVIPKIEISWYFFQSENYLIEEFPQKVAIGCSLHVQKLSEESYCTFLFSGGGYRKIEVRSAKDHSLRKVLGSIKICKQDPYFFKSSMIQKTFFLGTENDGVFCVVQVNYESGDRKKLFETRGKVSNFLISKNSQGEEILIVCIYLFEFSIIHLQTIVPIDINENENNKAVKKISRIELGRDIRKRENLQESRRRNYGSFPVRRDPSPNYKSLFFYNNHLFLGSVDGWISSYSFQFTEEEENPQFIKEHKEVRNGFMVDSSKKRLIQMLGVQRYLYSNSCKNLSLMESFRMRNNKRGLRIFCTRGSRLEIIDVLGLQDFGRRERWGEWLEDLREKFKHLLGMCGEEEHESTFFSKFLLKDSSLVMFKSFLV